MRLGHRRQCVAVLLQAAERLGDVGDDRLVDRRQRLGERIRERVLARPLGQLRRAELDQQVHQCAVALLAEAEQRLVDRAAVVAGAVVHRAAARDRVLQPVAGQRDARGVDQREALADALAGDEEPVLGDAAAGHGLQAATQRAERGRPVACTRPNSSQV